MTLYYNFSDTTRNRVSKLQHGIISLLAVVLFLSQGIDNVKADDDSGWFIGAGVSRLDADFEDESDLSLDDSDDTASIKAGYMFNDIFGLEVGYIDLGDYEGGENFKLDADAFLISAILNWSVTDLVDLYVKGGVAILDASSDQVIPGRGLVEEGDTEEEPFVGLGAELDFGTFNIFGEFSVVDTDINDLTIDIFTLGVKYEFPQ